MQQVLHDLLVFLFHLIPDEPVGLHRSDPKVWDALLSLQVADICRCLVLFLIFWVLGRLHNGSDLLLKLLVGLIEPRYEISKLGLVTGDDLLSLIQEWLLL